MEPNSRPTASGDGPRSFGVDMNVRSLIELRTIMSEPSYPRFGQPNETKMIKERNNKLWILCELTGLSCSDLLCCNIAGHI